MTRPIWVIADSLDRRRGGAESYLADLVDYMTRAGYPVRACVRRPVNSPSPAEIEVVPVWRSLGWLGEWHFARAMRLRLQGAGEVVFSTLPLALTAITHYLSLSGLICTGFEAERASFDAGLRQRCYRLGNRLNLRRQWAMHAQARLLTREPCPKILTFSTALRNQIRDLFKVPEASITTSPPGVDLTSFYPAAMAPEPGENLRLLFVGQNFRLKGLHCLLRALRTALSRGLRAELTVAGGRLNADFKTLAGALGLTSEVRFLGPVANDAMPQLYRSSDALIHPTFADHCSLVVLEALASGLPVITTRQNGAAELMEPGREGFIVEDPREIDALAAALLRLQEPGKLAEMRAAALAVRPRVDFADHARRVMSWLTGD